MLGEPQTQTQPQDSASSESQADAARNYVDDRYGSIPGLGRRFTGRN